MSSCLKIPRVLLPADGFEKWATPPCEGDEERLVNVALEAGDEPSTFRFFPLVKEGEHEEEYIESVKKYMYDALEKGVVSKLTRGCVLVRRTFPWGIRQGILACIDLEAVGESVHYAFMSVPSLVKEKAAIREKLPLELGRAVVLYKDKRNKISKLLRGEDSEELYNFTLMQGGEIAGYFLPEDISLDITRAVQAKSDALVVCEGVNEVAAAKAHWDKLKETLLPQERGLHPARFTLVELVNLFDDGVQISAPCYYMAEVDEEIFCDYFKRNVKCKREGNILYPALQSNAEGVKKCTELCRAYIKANGGVLRTVSDEEVKALESKEGVLVCLKPLDKEDIFDEIVKHGTFFESGFRFIRKGEERYYLEGVEISYD